MYPLSLRAFSYGYLDELKTSSLEEFLDKRSLIIFSNWLIICGADVCELVDGAEVCELVGIYILCSLAKLINKEDCGLYRDDGLLILRNVNGQQIDRMCKNIIKTFKDIGFAIDVETNLKIVDFLDTTFNLNNGTYRPYKKPNDLLLYINKSSNHLHHKLSTNC